MHAWFLIGFPAFFTVCCYAGWRERHRDRTAAFGGLDRLRAAAGLPRYRRLWGFDEWCVAPCVAAAFLPTLWDERPGLFPDFVHAAVTRSGMDLVDHVLLGLNLTFAAWCGWRLWDACRTRFAVAHLGAPRMVPVADGRRDRFAGHRLTVGTVEPTTDPAWVAAAGGLLWIMAVASGRLPVGLLLGAGAFVLLVADWAVRRAWALPAGTRAWLTAEGAVTDRRRVRWADADAVRLAPAADDDRLPARGRGGVAVEVDADGAAERFLIDADAAGVLDDLLAAVPPGRLVDARAAVVPPADRLRGTAPPPHAAPR